MTFPTQLTLARIGLTFLIMGLLFVPGVAAKAIALALFLLASFTDWLDGFLARRYHDVSDLGALLDPIADKVLILGMLLAFVQLRLIPAWMVLIVALREFVITGVRLYAASRHRVLSAATEGKHKTVSQMVAICALPITLVLSDLVERTAVPWQVLTSVHWAAQVCVWTMLLLTISSGVSFFWRHRRVLRHAQ